MVAPLCLWYQKNQRILPWRENRDPYRVWVSEIMLQQTRVEAALPYYQRFLEALPTVYDLAKAPEERLLKLWEGLGYYSRVRNMQKAAQIVVEQYGGQFPKDAAALEKLPGIGDYTAGAIASIAFGLPVPAVDGNVLRVIARLCNDDADIMLSGTKKRVKEALSAVYRLAEADAGDLTQAIMELGALVCVPGVPRCEACPLQRLCQAKAMGTEKTLPIRIVSKEKKTVKRTVFLLCCGDKVALVKRPAKGILAGMWEFPAAEGHLSRKQAEAVLRAQGIEGRLQSFVESRHVFTHLIWEMKSYLIFASEKNDAFSWFSLQELGGEIALPSAMKPFFRALTENQK
ncbi:MAG: A/G-specific adenine glycosylase [Ruminococcaceae bacterium]|nr:A/G-specific adenine glycosylase [Oscillospiraceae bacterium]